MKKVYERPEVEVMYFDGEDIITESSGVTLPPISTGQDGNGSSLF